MTYFGCAEDCGILPIRLDDGIRHHGRLDDIDGEDGHPIQKAPKATSGCDDPEGQL